MYVTCSNNKYQHNQVLLILLSPNVEQIIVPKSLTEENYSGKFYLKL